MKRQMYVVALLLLLGMVPAAWAGAKEEVAAATQAWADAVNSKDLDRILALYDPEAVLWGTVSPTLRDSPPTRGYRITTAYFRTGSTCPSHRQAPFCCYTLCVRVPTALRAPCARLRYSFGGDRPSQTARLPRSQGGFASLW